MVSCSQSDRPISFAAATDANLVESFSTLKIGETVTLSSPGGDPDYAQQLANIIRDKAVELTIEGFCISSCAEYLLAAPESLTFKNEPIIGFHQNPVMIEHFRSMKLEESDLPTCNYSDNAKVYEDYTAEPDAWKQTLDRLEILDVQLQELANCVLVGFKFKRTMWLPTSEQLRTIWKLDFEGSVCADDFKKCASQLKKVGLDSETIVIGDQTFPIQ